MYVYAHSLSRTDKLLSLALTNLCYSRADARIVGMTGGSRWVPGKVDKVDAQGPSITSVTALDIIAIMGSILDSRCVGRRSLPWKPTHAY